MTCKIVIEGEVSFTIDETGTEIHDINAAADVEGGLVAMEPPIPMTDAGADKLKNVLIDGLVAHIARETRKKLSAEGISPIIEIHREPIKGPVH